jgi:hypothetical protein
MPRGEVMGAALTASTGTIVRLHGTDVVEAHELPIDQGEAIDATLGRLLALAAPLRSWRAPPLWVALGPTHMQLRRLAHLPERTPEAMLTAIVRGNPERFFLRTAATHVTTRVARLEDGGLWAAALPLSLVRQLVVQACAHRVLLRGIVPTPAVLGFVTGAEALSWSDGALTVRAEYARGRLRTVRTLPAAEGESSLTGLPAALALAALGEDASRYLAAFAAVQASSAAPLRLVPGEVLGRPGEGEGEGVTARRAWAGVACAASLLFVVASPGLGALRAERAAQLHLATLAGERVVHERTERTLAAASADLAALTAFERSGTSMTLLLASLTETLEPPTMLISLRSDSLGGTLVVITPHSDALIAMLDRVPLVAEATIVGAVTPEAAPAVAPGASRIVAQALPSGSGPFAPAELAAAPAAPPEMERVTVRLRWRREHAAMRAATTIAGGAR